MSLVDGLRKQVLRRGNGHSTTDVQLIYLQKLVVIVE
jgi:hypothetical protein